MKKKRSFRTSRTLLVFGILLSVGLASGAIYQNANVSTDRKSYLPVGTLYDVNKKRMHLYDSKNPGSKATVVLAAGWGTANPYADFYPLYDGITKAASLVVYDRFGYGYSDITDKPRDIDTIVEEVHTLLSLANQKPPYILVGHSLASLEVIRYAQKYPQDVKGVVLLDGGNPAYYATTPPATAIGVIQRQLINLGIARLLYRFPRFVSTINSERNGLELLPAELKELDKTATLLIADNQNVIDEMATSQKNARKVVDGGTLNNIPLTILTSGDFGNAAPDWLKSQEDLKSWSQKSKQLVIDDSRHYIHQYQPEAVVQEILKLADAK